MRTPRCQEIAGIFAREAQQTGIALNPEAQAYQQELTLLIAMARNNPGMTIMDGVQKHLELRGYKYNGVLTHEAGHMIFGLIGALHTQRDLVFGGEQDFQSSHFAEIMSIAGQHMLRLNERQKTATADEYDVQCRIIEQHENYDRAIIWLIEQETQTSGMNLRYGQNNLLSLAFLLEGLNKSYRCLSAQHGALSPNFSWEIQKDDRILFYGGELHPDDSDIRIDCLPYGSNGVRVFQPFEMDRTLDQKRLYQDMLSSCLDTLAAQQKIKRPQNADDLIPFVNTVPLHALISAIETAPPLDLEPRRVAPPDDLYKAIHPYKVHHVQDGLYYKGHFDPKALESEPSLHADSEADEALRNNVA